MTPAEGPAPRNVASKLIESHLVNGEMVPGKEISVRVDQVLTHDATGPLIALELEAMGLVGGSARACRRVRGSPPPSGRF